jgi:hypothetical protein
MSQIEKNLKHLRHADLVEYELESEKAAQLLPTLIQETSLSILHQNCQSFNSHFNEFMTFITSLEAKFSIYAISELWCNKVEDFSHYDTLDGYEFKPKQRKRKTGGGVGMYVKNGIDFEILDIEIEMVDSLWIEIKTKNTTEIVGVIYRNEDITPNKFVSEFEMVLAKFQSENKKVTVCGDMNLNQMAMDYTSPYVQAIKLNNFSSLIMHPTHTSPTGTKSCIDHVITNKPSTPHAGTIHNDICRHTATFVVYADEMIPVPPAKVLWEDFSEYNKEKFNQRLQINLTLWRMECEMMETKQESMEKMYGDFVKVLLQTWSEFVTVKVDKLTPQMKKPWMTVAILKSVRKQHTLFAKVKKNPLNAELKEKHRIYKLQMTKIVQSAKKKYFSEFIEKIKSEPASAWGKIKELMGRVKKKTQKKGTI